MLIELRIKNFRSIGVEQHLSFVASKDPALPDNVVRDISIRGANRPSILRSILLYGANASGKSNICQALFYMRACVLRSATDLNEGDDLLGIVPFKLNSQFESGPSLFEVVVSLANGVYRYGFEATASNIEREWLFLTRKEPKSREVTIFERRGANKKEWTFGASFLGGARYLTEHTRPTNCLLLSKGAQESYQQLVPLFDWFRDRLLVVNMANPPARILNEVGTRCQKSPGRKDSFAQLAHVADPTVAAVDIKQEHVIVPQEVYDLLSTQIESSDQRSVELPKEFDTTELTVIRSQNDSPKDVSFDIDEESNGTQRFLAVSALLVEAYRKGQTLVLDELETSLHPLLTRQIVETINDPDLGTNGAQFIIASHDTNLFDFTLLRRDQIFLVQKGPDNQTDAFSVYDLSPKPKGDAAAERQYLNKRFGGVPSLGNLRLALAAALASDHESKTI